MLKLRERVVRRSSQGIALTRCEVFAPVVKGTLMKEGRKEGVKSRHDV
jgi:hypothetical protein